LGYDLHRTDPERPLILAGVRVESDFGLAGHSDADVVLHAVIDALLGAAGLPDIGELFPDSDPRYRGADSRALLREVLARLQQRRFEPANVDVTVCAEQPRLSPHKPAIRESLSHLLGLDRQAVSIKAKTNEGLGDLGRGRAIACWAVVGLTKVS
jgi:2-C-methyl-D-erythritol 2,4-cyclodiphosphate synthase